MREDQFSLYGFLTAREKQCFELLISASGVGPSLALKILSGMGLDELVPAIRKGDLAQLVRIPGVGRKTAERIVVELRDKLAVVDVPEAGQTGDAIAAGIRRRFGAGESRLRCALGRKAPSKSPRAKATRISKTCCARSLQILGSSAMQKRARAGREE